MRLNKLAKPQVKKYNNGVKKYDDGGISDAGFEDVMAQDKAQFNADMMTNVKNSKSNAKKASGANTANAIGGVAAMGSSAIDIATMNDPEPSMGASVGKGALSGAATGAALGSAVPIVGTAIGAAGGALVGATMGYFQGKGEREALDKEKKLKQEALDKQRNEQAVAMSQKALADVSNRGFTTSGNTQSSFYGKEGGRLKMLANGGIHIKPSHKGLFTAKATRAGEGVQEYASHVMANKEDFSPATVKQANFARNASKFKHGDGAVIKKDGGELQPVSKNTQLAVGQSHENGGIKLDSKSEIEGGETLVNKGDHTLVVSDNLVNPLSGNTFAKDDLKLAKSLSKYEGKTSNLAKNSVRQINAKREILHSMQQKMNGDATDEEQNQNMAENGMKLNNIGVAGQGLTSEDITYKADIPIAGRPSPIRYAPKEVKKLNMISKPVQYPVPLRPQAPNYAENGMKMYKNGGDYYSDYKKTGTADLGGGYIVRKGSDGKVEYSKDKGKTFSRPSKEVYTKLNSSAFKGKLGAYREPKTESTSVKEADKNVMKPVNSDNTLPDNFLQRKYTAPSMTSVDYGKTVLDQAVESGDLYKPNLRKSENITPSPTATPAVKKESKPKTKEPRDYSSLKSGVSSLAKLGAYTAPALIDYANQQKNIARLKGIAIPEAPQQGFVNLAKQNMEVDRADIRKQQANYNAGLSGTIADSQTAALMKANVAEQSANALSRVNQAQRNANIQTANAQTEMNLGIDAKNRASKYGQALQQMEKDVDISNRTADVKSKLISDIRNVQNTYRQEKYADAALDVDLAGMSPEARAEFNRSTKARGHYGRYIVKNGGKLSNLTKLRI